MASEKREEAGDGDGDPIRGRRAAKPMPSAKARSYFRMSHNYNLGHAPGITLLNFEALKGAANRSVLGPPRGQRGFPCYPETPRFLIDRKLGRRVRDLEQYHEYWLVSPALKAVFEAVDREAFAFHPCQTVLPDGGRGQELWLCDVVPLLDAVDEAASTVRVIEPPGKKRYYQFLSNTSLVFRPDIVGNRHVFRLLYREAETICDDIIMDACKAARWRAYISEMPRSNPIHDPHGGGARRAAPRGSIDRWLHSRSIPHDSGGRARR